MRGFVLALVFSALAAADDSGVTPRDNSADYPGHQTFKSLSIGAVLLSSDQVKKLFSNEINSKYAVVEVAIYPEQGEVDVDYRDFALKLGERTLIRPDRPDDVASSWPEKKSPLPGNTHVTTETGVVCSTGTGAAPYPTNPDASSGSASNYPNNNYPNNGRVRGCGTYEGVAVSNSPTAAPPPTSSPRVALDAKVRERALPQGKTSRAVAGYVYFAASAKQRKGASVSLEYSRDSVSAELVLPTPK